MSVSGGRPQSGGQPETRWLTRSGLGAPRSRRADCRPTPRAARSALPVRCGPEPRGARRDDSRSATRLPKLCDAAAPTWVAGPPHWSSSAGGCKPRRKRHVVKPHRPTVLHNGRPGAALRLWVGTTTSQLRGLALEIGDLGRLVVGALLVAGHLLLGLALALLLATLAAQGRIARHVAGGLLGLACDLVQKAHDAWPSLFGVAFDYPSSPVPNVGASRRSGPRRPHPGNAQMRRWISVIPSRTLSITHTTRSSSRTRSLNARRATAASDWSSSPATLPLHRVLSATMSPRSASFGRTAS